MAFLRAVKKIEPQDFRNYERGIGGTVDTIIGQLIRRQALSVECAKAGFITKERTTGHCHASLEQRFNRCVQPDNGDALRTKEFGCALLCIGSPAQGKDDRLLYFRCAAKDRL